MILLANILVAAAAVYVALGLLFAAAFVKAGAVRLNPSAAHSTVGFRLLIVPGTVALWPLLASRWMRGKVALREKTPHTVAAGSRREVRA